MFFIQADRTKMNHADWMRRRAERMRARGDVQGADHFEKVAYNLDGHSWQTCPRCGAPRPFRHLPCYHGKTHVPPVDKSFAREWRQIWHNANLAD
jgi:hypothetical protein